MAVDPTAPEMLLNQVFETRALTIEAHPRKLHEVREWAGVAASDAGFDGAGCHQVKLAVSEVVANAICHGSTNEDDVVQMEASRRDGALVFEVRDTGTFVPPAGPSTDDDESGRGLEVLALTMDEVHIAMTDEGSLVRFLKRLP
jgi:anti-sigma regulatory factor (Ser/Thr protein kinase)